MSVYFDHSSTTPCLPSAVKLVKESLSRNFGNPSSVHELGLKAEKILKDTRKVAASVLKVKPEQIFFTSGGTEANNLALRGLVKNRRQRPVHIISSFIEHDSVYRTLQDLRGQEIEVTFIKPNSRGIIDPEKVKQSFKANTILVSIMQVNNETGALQPVREIGNLIKQLSSSLLFHVDAVQGLGHVPIALKEWQVDLASFSGHKIGAPKGTGFLYLKNQNLLKPIITGGDQENRLRSGTENVPGIPGLGAALEEIPELKQKKQPERLLRLKKHFLQQLDHIIPEALLNTPEESAPHIINFSLKKLPGEVLVNAMSSRGFYISSGSACHARRNTESRVLKKMGLSDGRLQGALRVSFGRQNQPGEIDRFLAALREEYDLLQ